ncbi:hypothetical protein [Deinococcus sonorensis]|uniref:Integrase n=2 Tax=Deinococcus sonorensis TaxID=309891 RepID=A0AAU7U4Q4_9DEIO
MLSLPGPWQQRPLAETRTRLTPIFSAAQRDHVNLFAPGDDFHSWLMQAVSVTRHGPGTARANTMRARLSTLASIYTTLLDEELLSRDPMHGLVWPPLEHRQAPLPPPEEVTRLLRHAEPDLPLHAALTLIVRHAFQVADLLALRWPAFYHADGTLLRRRTLTRLDDPSYRSLERLLAQAGGPLADPQGPIFPYRTLDDLRRALFALSLQANVPFISPSQLRQVSLRDVDHTASSAGFASQRREPFEQAVALARSVSEKLNSSS